MSGTAQAKKDRSLAALVERAQFDPVWFAQEVLNLRQLEGEPDITQDPDQSWELDVWQAELLHAVADVWRKMNGVPTVFNHEGKTQFTVRSSHGPGKTFGIAVLAHWFNFCFKGRILATAPKFSQVTTQLFPEFRKINNRSEAWYKAQLDVGEVKATWFNDPDWVMLADSASKPENIAGKHWQYMLVLVDEATGVPETIWPVIESALSNGVLLILVTISNPTKMTGSFAMSHLKDSIARDYYRMHVNGKNSMRITYSPTKRAYVERMERKYGRTSPVVKVRCYGEFASSEAGQVLALEWLQAARDKEVDPLVGDGSLPRNRISVDCAAGGENETVITGVRHFDTVRIGLKMRRFSFELKTASADTASAAIKLFNDLGFKKETDDFVVDANGVGAGAAGILAGLGYRVVFYMGGEASDNPKRWRVRRVQSYMNARDDLKDGNVALVDNFLEDEQEWEDFYGQLCSIKHPPDTDKVDDLMTKAEMVRQGIQSPDMADSWAMQYATQSPSIVPTSVADERQATLHVVVNNVNRGLM